MQQDFFILLVILMIPIFYINIKQFLLVKKIMNYDVEINSVFIHRNKRGVVLELNNANVVRNKMKICAMIRKRKKIRIRFGNKVNNNSYDFIFLKKYVKLNYDLLSDIVILLHFISPKRNFLPICQMFENLSLCCITTNIVINVIIGNSNFFCYIIILVITTSFLIFYIHDQLILSLPTKTIKDGIDLNQKTHSTISSIKNRDKDSIEDIDNSSLIRKKYSNKTLSSINMRLTLGTRVNVGRGDKVNKDINRMLQLSKSKKIVAEQRKKEDNKRKDEKKEC
jgi:hypothetical protein